MRTLGSDVLIAVFRTFITPEERILGRRSSTARSAPLLNQATKALDDMGKACTDWIYLRADDLISAADRLLLNWKKPYMPSLRKRRRNTNIGIK
jgi:hypothetical protein